MRTPTATADDTDTVPGLAVDSGLLQPEDIAVVAALMDDYFAGADRRGQ